MTLNNGNYYSREADEEYISVSQYKDFIGTIGRPACEAAALAKLRGKWVPPMTKPMLIGSYVDSYFEGTLDLFKESHPEIFTQSGELKAEFKKANEIIARVKQDEMFMLAMSGEKQRIFIGEIGGALWKCKLDVYHEGKFITDLKVVKKLTEAHSVRDFGIMDFIQYWGYDLQGAVYQEIVRQNTGEQLPFMIAAVSKEEEPDIGLLSFTQAELDECLTGIESNVSKIQLLKRGEIEPIRCERCDYCKRTKKIKAPVHHSALIAEV